MVANSSEGIATPLLSKLPGLLYLPYRTHTLYASCSSPRYYCRKKGIAPTTFRALSERESSNEWPRRIRYRLWKCHCNVDCGDASWARS